MKVAVIGGGSSYTPELIHGFLERADRLPLAELWLMDTSPSRLEILGRFAQRMVAARGAPFTVHLTTDQEQAVHEANYVIVQLRVGGMAARREDEYLGRRHQLVGQETTGVGGMAKALRTIPVVLQLAQQMEASAPGALLVNFTNPAGLIAEALARHAPEVPSVGVCNAPLTTKMHMLQALADRGHDIAPERAHLDTLGLNHLSWHRGLSLDGVDVWPQLLAAYLTRLRDEDTPEWPPDLIKALGLVPNYYLHYYYHTDRALAKQAHWPPSRAEEVMQIERDLLSRYAEPDRLEPPDELMERGGAYYSTVATQLLHAHHNDLGERHVLNVPHRGAVAGWPPDWVLEMPCRVDATGIHPLPTAPLPPVCYGLLAQVKMYELLTVEAAVRGDPLAAFQALLAHPLGPPADRVQSVLDDLLEANRAYLPQFWEQGARSQKSP